MKTVFLCKVLICRHSCLKLQKVDKGDGTSFSRVGDRNKNGFIWEISMAAKTVLSLFAIIYVCSYRKLIKVTAQVGERN